MKAEDTGQVSPFWQKTSEWYRGRSSETSSLWNKLDGLFLPNLGLYGGAKRPTRISTRQKVDEQRIISLVKCGDPNNPAGPFIKRNGMPCGKDCAKFGTRCSLHSGESPAAKVAAERAMALARLPGAELLLDMIEQHQQSTCGTCGYPSADPHIIRNVLRAIQMVFDRTGMPPVMRVETVNNSDMEFTLDHLTEQELSEFSRIMSEFKALKASIKARMHMVVLPADGQEPTSLPTPPNQIM